MFGLGYNPNIANAEAMLRSEFGISLDGLPEPMSVRQLFDKLSKEGRLSPDAQIALLYRLAAFNFLACFKMMQDSGEVITDKMLLTTARLAELANNWEGRAADRNVLEKLTSKLDESIANYIRFFRMQRE